MRPDEVRCKEEAQMTLTKSRPGLIVQKATLSDAEDIYGLVREFAGKDEMLSRSMEEICTRIRDFFVARRGGVVAGIVSLHIWDAGLAEVRSLAVAEPYRRVGVGRALVEAALGEARDLGIKRVFALTYAVDFFLKMGFREVDKATLPQKIWGDCVECRKFPGCDETALLIDL
jgi:amino-acid N-acetyltransferase